MQLELERAWHNCTTISRKIYSLVIHSHLKTQEHLSSLDMTTDLEESDCFGKISKHFILFDNLPRSPILLFDAQHKMQFILVLCFVYTTAEISRIVVWHGFMWQNRIHSFCLNVLSNMLYILETCQKRTFPQPPPNTQKVIVDKLSKFYSQMQTGKYFLYLYKIWTKNYRYTFHIYH